MFSGGVGGGGDNGSGGLRNYIFHILKQ